MAHGVDDPFGVGQDQKLEVILYLFYIADKHQAFGEVDPRLYNHSYREDIALLMFSVELADVKNDVIGVACLNILTNKIIMILSYDLRNDLIYVLL